MQNAAAEWLFQTEKSEIVTAMTSLQFYLDNFMRECQSGQDARLHMECHAGQVWPSFHFHVDHPPPKQQQQHRRPYGPSRLCRRARRADACAAANAAIKKHVAVEVNTAEKAVQTEINDEDLSTTSATEEAAQQPSCNFNLPAEQADYPHPPDVPNTFCPDHDFEAAA